MKRIIAILMVLAFALSMVACQTPSEGTGTPSTTPSATGTTTAPETTEEEIVPDLKAGTYQLKHVSTGYVVESTTEGKIASGDNAAYSVISVDWIIRKKTVCYKLGLFKIEKVTHKESKEIIDNVEPQTALSMDKAKNGSPIKTASNKFGDNYVLWVLYPNEDGTYCIAPALKPEKARLGMVDGQMCIVDYNEGDDLTNLKWSFENKSTDNPIYYETVSEKGNAIVRVPLDVFDNKNYSGSVDLETGKFVRYTPTAETLQRYAENVQLCMETYTELTNFEPYKVIIVHGYNYQGVMAGVVGNNNNVFVNCGPGEWFYSDLEKMHYRFTKMDRNDVNFMVLHEIGHMYDYDRGWNFESEMEADLKAAYLLNTVEGTYAAPAEYSAKECFNGETIASGGFGGLSGGVMTSKYSIYRNAQIYAEFCNEIGWENLKKTFHWFQSDEGKKACSSSASKYEKFKTFTDKLCEYGGVDLWAKFNATELAVLETTFEKPAETEE